MLDNPQNNIILRPKQFFGLMKFNLDNQLNNSQGDIDRIHLISQLGCDTQTNKKKRKKSEVSVQNTPVKIVEEFVDEEIVEQGKNPKVQ